MLLDFSKKETWVVLQKATYTVRKSNIDSSNLFKE